VGLVGTVFGNFQACKFVNLLIESNIVPVMFITIPIV